MTRYDDPYDVIVVGAGVIGCAAARELAPDHDVLVLDRGQVASETTAKASGLMTVVPDLPEFPEAARHALSFFREYDGTRNFSLTPRHSVHLVTDDEEAWAREHAAGFRENGFDVAYRDAGALAERYPDAFVLEEFVGGIEFAETGWVDPYTYAMALKEDAEERGAEVRTGVEVESVAGDDAVAGVEVDGEPVAADHVVCATGWRTRPLLAEHVEVPVRPFRWQAVNLDVGREFGEGFPMAWDRESRLYWRPEHNGQLHVGGGTYYVDDRGDVRESVTEAFRNQVAETITRRVPDVEDARFVGEDCCPTGDAATPDDRPIVDAPDELEGLVVAVAGPVGGIMCSPFVSTAVRALVTGEDAPFPLEPHSLDRFEDRSDDFECYYVTGWAAPGASG